MSRRVPPGWIQTTLPMFSSPGKTSEPAPLIIRKPVASKPLEDQNTGSSPVSATSFRPLGTLFEKGK
jgi:hypothetical protein